jgi:hypothetical protein|tara:strand:+ start:592 stop:897 length:306 start_codon:yes stop_codon:yes gene_type:complete
MGICLLFENMKNKITKQKIEKYYNLTSKALKIARKAVVKSKQKQAEEIFLMVESYLSDSQYFKEEKDFINAYGALNYAHGWLDCGARLKIYKVTDNKLFTV